MSSREEDALLGIDADEASTSKQHNDSNQPDYSAMMDAIFQMSESVKMLAQSKQMPPSKRRRHCISDSDSDDESTHHIRGRAQASSSSDQCDDVAPLLRPSTSDQKSSSAQLLDDIARELDDVKLSPAVSEGVSKIVNKRFSSKMKIETLKKKKELYIPPANCENLKVPLCNKDVFLQMKRYHKTRKTSLIRIQSDVSKVGVVLTELANIVHTAQNDDQKLSKPELIRKLTDGIALLGSAFMNISQHRRDMAVGALNRDYLQLAEIPASPDWLFGEASELTKKMKEIKELQRMGKPLHYQSAYNRPSKNWRDYKQNSPYRGRGRYRGKYQQKNGKKPN